MKNEKRNKFIVSVLLLCILSVSVFAPTASAVYYEGSFPYAETGLTGGAFIECDSTLGDICIVFPTQYIDKCLTFTTGGNLFNVTNSTINCLIFDNGVQYSGRFQAFGTLQYRPSNNTSYSYVDVVTSDVEDTNVIFDTASERVNENYYFTYYEQSILSVLILILIFVFLGWFLWHRKR